MTNVEIDRIVYACRQSGDDSTYAIVRAALAALKHPAVKPDMLVNGGALKLALNVLRRAGKNEVADELECTAQVAPVDAESWLDLLAEARSALWQPRDDAVFVVWWSDHMPNSTEADAWVEWCALRSNQPAAHLAAKWQVVPRQLTQDMAEAAKFVDGRLSVFKYADAYRAMLYAAPTPPLTHIGDKP